MQDFPEGSMAVAEITRPGGPEVLVSARRPIPRPGPGELLVKVAAAGVNRVDALQRGGGYPHPRDASDIPGVELSGTVVGVGPQTTRFLVGNELCALVSGGGYAEYAVVSEETALPLPLGVSLVDAAGLPEVYFTVWMNLVENGAVTAGSQVLVHGGTSGIGSGAILLARALGAVVLATAGSEEKCAACRALGANRAINYRTEDFLEVVRSETGGRGVDIVLDIVGGDYVARNYAACAENGRILQVGFMAGREAQIDVLQLMYKRLSHIGASLRPQPLEVKAAIAGNVAKSVWPFFAVGKLRPVTDQIFPLAEAAAAHRRLEASSHTGKILLVPSHHQNGH